MHKRYVTEHDYIIANENGDIAFGNEKGLSYWNHSLEAKDIKKYAKENNVKAYGLSCLEFFIVFCLVHSLEGKTK